MTPKQQTVGEKIYELRNVKSWSQRQFASIASISRRTVGRIERGENNPTKETLLQIAGALDIDVTELTELLPAPPKSRAKKEVHPISNGRQLIDILFDCHQFGFEVDETEDDDEAGFITEILAAAEWRERWDEVEAAQRYEIGRSVSKPIKALEERGWTIIVTRRMGAREVHGIDTGPDWIQAIVSIEKSSPEMFAAKFAELTELVYGPGGKGEEWFKDTLRMLGDKNGQTLS